MHRGADPLGAFDPDKPAEPLHDRRRLGNSGPDGVFGVEDLLELGIGEAGTAVTHRDPRELAEPRARDNRRYSSSSNVKLRVPTISVPSAFIAALAASTRSSTVAATAPPSVRHGHSSASSEKRQRTLPRTRWRMRRSSGASTSLRSVERRQQGQAAADWRRRGRAVPQLDRRDADRFGIRLAGDGASAGVGAAGSRRRKARARSAARTTPPRARSPAENDRGDDRGQAAVVLGRVRRFLARAVDKAGQVGAALQHAGAEHAGLDLGPAIGIRIAERDFRDSARAGARHRPGSGRTRRYRRPAARRACRRPAGRSCRRDARSAYSQPFSEAARKRRTVSRLGRLEALQREQAVAVILDPVIGRVERFEDDPALMRLPRHDPRRADRGVDRMVGERRRRSGRRRSSPI